MSTVHPITFGPQVCARLNEGARDLYVPDDPRRAETWVHFLGVQAEWWFNSTYR